MPIIRALPRLQSGRAFLELRNDFDKSVTVKDVLVATKAAGPLTPLLAEPKQLSPGEAPYIEITEKLFSLFNQQTSEAQDKRIAISLTLEPEPAHQPGPSYYHLRLEDGVFTEFSSSLENDQS